MGLSETAKYVLARLLLHYGNMPSSDRSSELASLMGLSHTAIVESLRELCRARSSSPLKQGYLIRERIYGANLHTQAGRPRFCYRVESGFLAELLAGSRKVGDELQGEIVANLLLTGGRSKWSEIDHGQKREAPKWTLERVPRRLRYLLAVLWSLSDETGAVWGCSLKAIAHVSGIHGAKLESLLKSLQKQSFILRRVPPYEGGEILRRFPGAMILNPVHLLISRDIPKLKAHCCVTPSPEAMSIWIGNIFNEVHRIHDIGKDVQTNGNQVALIYGKSLELVQEDLINLKNDFFSRALAVMQESRGTRISDELLSLLQDDALDGLLKLTPISRQLLIDAIFYFSNRVLSKRTPDIANGCAVWDEAIYIDIEAMLNGGFNGLGLAASCLIAPWVYYQAILLAMKIFNIRLVFYKNNPLSVSSNSGCEKQDVLTLNEFYCAFPRESSWYVDILSWRFYGEDGSWGGF